MRSKLHGLLIAAACTSVGIGAGAVVAHASTGTPEVDRANTTIQASATIKPVTCVGEDGMPYVTFFGAWKGTESQMTPDATDYKLTGSFSVTGVQWTINRKTLRGVLTGKVALINSAGAPVYSGGIVLVTQGLPQAGAVVPARGLINAVFQLPDEGVTPNDDRLIANVEFKLGSTFANGQFGDLPGSLGIPNYSVVSNMAPTAADGTC